MDVAPVVFFFAPRPNAVLAELTTEPHLMKDSYTGRGRRREESLYTLAGSWHFSGKVETISFVLEISR